MIFNSLTFLRFLSIFSVCVLASLFLVVPFFTQAAHDTPPTFHSAVALEGYAWSPNIGWISMNCLNNSECGTSSYKVSINPDQTLSGYAWSANIGWIQFGGLSGMPSGGVYTGNARVAGSVGNWNLEGWARTLAYGGGWDGWISLSGTAPDYAVKFNDGGNMNNASYAWGSSVVGWTNFSTTYFTTPCISENACTVDHADTIFTNLWCQATTTSCAFECTSVTGMCRSSLAVVTGNLIVDVPLVRKNGVVHLDWSLTIPSDAESCEVTGDSSQVWTGISGVNVTSSPITKFTTVFTLSCIPTGGGTPIIVDTETVKLIPVIYES